VDLVGAARGLMAEPHLVKHALEGREEDSRTCTHCNICRRRGRGMWGCAINPATGRERHWGVDHFAPAATRSRVVVAGGGPGGLEAARVAALKGHEVVVLERSDRIGGQLNRWAKLPGRDIFATTPEWYGSQLAKLGVDVRLGATATVDSILAERPDAVIVATGSHYIRTGENALLAWPVPGWDRDFVRTPEEVIDGDLRFGGRVIVFDGEGLNTQAGIAEILAAGGAQVTLVTRQLEPVDNMTGTEEYVSTIPILKNLGVELLTMTSLRSIGDHQVTLFDVYTEKEWTVDGIEAVVMATCRMPNDRLIHELEGRVAQLFAVGDALAPRSLPEAIHEGQRFARLIGEPDAPADFIEAYFAPIDYSTFQRPASVLLQPAAPRT
jgi:pyruvate/2-oxoglutarate dehydrogenase complex dihydrolipoamide dehydrogenase (E3) component